MNSLSNMLFGFGILCIPLSWVMWYFGPEVEFGRQIMNEIADPAVRAALQEAHAERWGIFVATWPVTLLLLSHLVELKERKS